MSGFRRNLFRPSSKARVFATLAALLVCGAVCLVGEGLYFRARASRVEGVVVGHGSRDRPIVAYRWGERDCRHEEGGPSSPLAVGDRIGVYVLPERPSATRLDWPIGLLFLPAWFCVMPAMFFAAYGLAVAVWGDPPDQPL